MATAEGMVLTRFNERVKLVASMINSLGAALVAGSVARVWVDGITATVLFDLVIWLPTAVALILVSMRYLEFLEPGASE